MIRKNNNSALGKAVVYLFCTILGMSSIACAETCEVGGSNGFWKLVDTQSPNAWDGVYVYHSTIGKNKYSVDWCGWFSKKGQECNQNCRGSSSSFGTSWAATNGAKPCAPESAKIYRWICNDCRNAYNQKILECEEDEFLYWDNVTCTGYCEIKPQNQGPPDECPTR